MDCIVKNIRGHKIEKLYQWDKNQQITITMLPKNKFVNLEDNDVEIHFWNQKSKKATVVDGNLTRNSVTVMIPNEFLDEGLDIKLYVYLTKDEVSNTIAEATIKVVQRIEKEGE